MMNYLTGLRGCLLATALVSSGVSQRAGADDKRPTFLGPAAPEELQVFAPLVGQWSTKTVSRPSVESKDGQTGTGEMTGQWLHNGHFLRLEGWGEVKNGRLEFTILLTYDRNQKVYRRWAFTSSGTVAESTGRWDEPTKTMTWTNRSAAGATYVVKQVLDKDRFVESHLQKRADGPVVRDLTVTAQRKKLLEK
jgi:Protein of unknown function (DUF1579)